VPRDSDVERLVRERRCSRVGDGEVDMQAAFGGLRARPLDHLRRQVDAGDVVTELREAESEESRSAADIEHAARRLADGLGDELVPRPPLLLADEAMAGLVVGRCPRGRPSGRGSRP
jgi:hypothetical protein